MHDIDRTGDTEYETDSLEADAFEYEFADEGGFTGDTEAGSPFTEVEEMEMAADLLEVTDEAELDQFLGNLIKKAGRGVGKFIKSPLGRSLGGILKGAVKQALPLVGGSIGTALGGPVGGMIGGKLASAAGGLFGLELEGMSLEDQEFEVARRVVRFAGAATKNAALTQPDVDPRIAAKNAVISAAQKHAPGLIGGAAGNVSTGYAQRRLGRSGRWIRKGRRIILFGV